MKMKRIEIAIHIIFWILTSWIIVSVNSIEVQEIEVINGEEIKQVFRSKDLITYFFIGQCIFLVIFYLTLHFTQQLGKAKQLNHFVFKLLATVMSGMIVYYIIIRYFVYHEPIQITNITYGILVFYLSVALAYGFIKIWIKNEQDKKQLELINNRAALDMLKSQLQPHFLFNTMNNLLAMVDQKNDPKLANSIDKLSSLLRYVVYEAKKDKVLVSSEIEFIKNFSQLHLLRFEDGEIDYKINIVGTNDQQLIEPGLLLCYVENAFKHGVQPETETFIHIDINLEKANEIKFSINNSIPNNTTNAQEGGFGLSSNNERLKLAYPEKHTLSIDHGNTYLVELIIKTNEGNNS